jgi:dolichol-phosphate mannosyltransferase
MKLGFGEDYPLGFPTITLLIALLGGVQLVAIGILGEYVGRVYEEVKGRPPYIVDRFFNAPIVQPLQVNAPEGDGQTGGVESQP